MHTHSAASHTDVVLQTTPATTDWRERATVDVETAGKILGVGRSAAYRLARREEIPVLRLGRRFVVPVAALRRLLGELV